MTRITARLKGIEAMLVPKGRLFAFICLDLSNLPPRADQLADFKVANGVGPVGGAIPAFATRAALQPRPAKPPALAERPIIN
jgi:hypothetical protein